jgi:hypothetical protein
MLSFKRCNTVVIAPWCGRPRAGGTEIIDPPRILRELRILLAGPVLGDGALAFVPEIDSALAGYRL